MIIYYLLVAKNGLLKTYCINKARLILCGLNEKLLSYIGI